MIRRTLAVGLATLATVAATVLGVSSPAQAAVCAYNVPLTVNGWYWLTVTTCVERSGAYVRGTAWTKNTSTVPVYIDADVATEHGGAYFYKGWLNPGKTAYGASKWLVDTDITLNRSYAMTDFYTTAGGWRYNLLVNSPAG